MKELKGVELSFKDKLLLFSLFPVTENGIRKKLGYSKRYRSDYLKNTILNLQKDGYLELLGKARRGNKEVNLYQTVVSRYLDYLKRKVWEREQKIKNARAKHKKAKVKLTKIEKHIIKELKKYYGEEE